MALTEKEVEHIAWLARLELSAQEKARFRVQLSDILDYVAQLQQLNIRAEDLAPSASPTPARLREDEPRQGLTTAEALCNAPDQYDGQFRVPPVLE